LFWRNTVAGKTHHIGTAQKQHEDPALLIIDGQQRLTALYAVFRDQEVKDENYDNRKILVAFNPVTEQFKVADASTEHNPEYINSVSEFLTRSSTRVFINGYLKQLAKYYGELSVKQALIRTKIEENADLSKQDVELITGKIKVQAEISDEAKALLEKKADVLALLSQQSPFPCPACKGAVRLEPAGPEELPTRIWTCVQCGAWGGTRDSAAYPALWIGRATVQ